MKTSIYIVFLLSFGLLIASATPKYDDPYRTIESIVKDFLEEGYSARYEYIKDQKTMSYYEHFSNPEKVVNIIHFQHKEHPCYIIEFDNERGALRYEKHPMIKKETKRIGNDHITRSGRFVLVFDIKAHFNHDMVRIFKHYHRKDHEELYISQE